MAPGVRAGLAGYYLKQITDARISGHTVPDPQERVGAIGPGLIVSGKDSPFTSTPSSRSARRIAPKGGSSCCVCRRYFDGRSPLVGRSITTRGPTTFDRADGETRKNGLDAAGLSGGRVRLIHAFGSADEQVGLAAIT